MADELKHTCTAEWIFDRYESVRSRLPIGRFPSSSQRCSNLGDLLNRFDAFLFDSYGVLNTGGVPIEGAPQRIEMLRQAGKQVAVLTNAATEPLSKLTEKYARLGFSFARNEIISSRELLSFAMEKYPPSTRWGIAAPSSSDIKEFGVIAHQLDPQNDSYDRADCFVLLSSEGWTSDHQVALKNALVARPRPLLVGNPDLAAPRESSFSVEPGTHAHEVADAVGVVPEFYGKPFSNAFDEAIRRFGSQLSKDRIAMVGDTLHTDILGASSVGIGTILVTDYGLLKDLVIDECIEKSKIRPHYIIPNI